MTEPINTLIPVLEKHKEAFGEVLEEVTADSGYCSEKNLLYLEEHKENENFRRFNYRTAEKVYKEFMLYAIGRNINKYHRFLHHEIERYEGKTEQKTA